MQTFGRILAGAVVTLALAACSGSSSPTTGPAAATTAASGGGGGTAAACSVATTGGSVAAAIKGFAFVPPTISAKVGDTVTWTNNDTTAHTVTLDSQDCDSGSIAPGATANLKFTAAGTYPFHCKIHPGMKGTITVTG